MLEVCRSDISLLFYLLALWNTNTRIQFIFYPNNLEALIYQFNHLLNTDMVSGFPGGRDDKENKDDSRQSGDGVCSQPPPVPQYRPPSCHGQLKVGDDICQNTDQQFRHKLYGRGCVMTSYPTFSQIPC